MNPLSNYTDTLPDEIMLQVFSNLPFKAVILGGEVCKKWKELLDDVFIWTPFSIVLPYRSQVESDLKSNIIEKVKILKKAIREDAKKVKVAYAHITLSHIGLSSLSAAHQCARDMASIEYEYKMMQFYDFLVFEYIKNNCLAQAEEVVIEMDEHPSPQSLPAFQLVQYYIKINDLQKALSSMNYISQNLVEADKSLSLLIHAAEKTNNIEIAISALNTCKEWKMWAACAKNFINFLSGIEEFEKVEQVRAINPTACERAINS